MRLKKLSIYNFRNYAESNLEFESDVICLLGKNGSGKTNLLDAIHYLSFTKSFLNSSDTFSIRIGEGAFSVKGNFQRNTISNEVLCSYVAGGKKNVREDGSDYAKLSEHIGKYPVVLVAPNDIALIGDTSEVRRRFFDGLISQINSDYLDQLIVYTNHLKARNAALRHFAEKGKTDMDLLEVYHRKMAPAADFIFKTRQEFTRLINPVLARHYAFLSQSTNEATEIHYKSELENSSMAELLKENVQRDLVMQRTSSGIHRDDYIFQLQHQELKRFGSQGQQKSFLIGLKLAEFEVIEDRKGYKPLLLLDDIFDKLDDERIARLIERVATGMFGQLFLTDARPDRTRGLMGATALAPQVFSVEEGRIRAL